MPETILADLHHPGTLEKIFERLQADYPRVTGRPSGSLIPARQAP